MSFKEYKRHVRKTSRKRNVRLSNGYALIMDAPISGVWKVWREERLARLTFTVDEGAI